MPNWRSGLFYYRYVRKMGMTEVIVILFVIISIGQYLVNWGAYLEKKLTLVSYKNIDWIKVLISKIDQSLR